MTTNTKPAARTLSGAEVAQMLDEAGVRGSYLQDSVRAGRTIEPMAEHVARAYVAQAVLRQARAANA